MSELTIAFASRADVPEIMRFISELAEFEKLSHLVSATPEMLEQELFGEKPGCEVLIAKRDGAAVGFAVLFSSFSTFLGKKGLFLEDLYVQPDQRGTGAGKALLQHVIKLAKDRGCGRCEWNVLDWNEKAISFYESMGAEAQKGWTTYRVSF